MIHLETHPVPVDGCQPCRWASVAVAASATPSRLGGARAAQLNHRERQQGLDMDAYRRLRRDGVQPPQIDGCAVREQRAETREQVEA